MSVPLHLAEAGSASTVVAGLAVDEHVDDHLVECLLAKRSGPPECGLGDVDAPLDLVGAAGHHVRLLVDDVAVDRGPHHDGALRITVETGRDAQVRSSCVGIPAEDAESVDAHRTGVVDERVPPEAAGVPVAGDVVGLLQHAGDVAPVVGAGLWRTGGLDREHVVVGQP